MTPRTPPAQQPKKPTLFDEYLNEHPEDAPYFDGCIHTPISKNIKKFLQFRLYPAPTLTYTDGHSDGFRAGYEEGVEVGEARCETHHEEMKAQAARQAREIHAKELMSMVEYRFEKSHNGKYIIKTIKEILESLRQPSEQEQPR